jgi:hypothetical protein
MPPRDDRRVADCYRLAETHKNVLAMERMVNVVSRAIRNVEAIATIETTLFLCSKLSLPFTLNPELEISFDERNVRDNDGYGICSPWRTFFEDLNELIVHG